jgi:hypothetical protein
MIIKMKTRVLSIIFLIICTFSSCLDDEGYSLDNFRVDFGILDEQESEEYIIVLDDDSRLYPVAGFIPRHTLQDGERVLVDYTILGDKNKTDGQKEYYVRINSIGKILKKGIINISPAIEDSIGDDPVIIRDAWMSKNQLLNFRIRYYGNDKVHFINLVKQPGKLTSQNQPIQLELRHNRNRDREIYPMTAFVSFELDSIRINGLDSVRFEVRSVDYDDESHTFEGVCHFK